MYKKTSLKNMAVIIDCNHGNSNKCADAQGRIMNEVINSMNENTVLYAFVKGFMVESYLEDGNQIIGGGVYGKSITDASIGWEKTEKLIVSFAENIKL